MRNLVEKLEALLEQAVSPLQRRRLFAAEEAGTGDIGDDARADTGFAVGIAGHTAGDGSGAVVLRLAGLGLESEAISEGPASRLAGLD